MITHHRLNKASFQNTFLIGSIVIPFFVLSLVNVLKHEMWRDELQDWLLAQNSHSVMDLICHMRYESHPGLWHLSLYFLKQIVNQPHVMQIFHVLVGTGVVFLVVKYAPFTFLQKFLLVTGYFFIYEYTVISRNYILEILCLFVFCAIYPSRKKQALWLAVCLFFLCQTNFFGVIFSLTLWGIILLECFFDKEFWCIFLKRKTDIILGTLIVLFGVSLSIVQIIQHPDSGQLTGWKTDFDLQALKNTIATIWNGFVPIPEVKMQFWNSNILDAHLELKVLLSVLIFALCCLLLSRRPLILLFFIISSTGILTFFYTKFLGYIRHHGQLFVIFIVCLWLASSHKTLKIKVFPSFFGVFFKHQTKFIAIILLLHMIAGIIAVTFDWQYPFSASKEVATFIKANQLSDLLLVGHLDYTTSAVAGHLGKEFYYPNGNRFGTFIIWDKRRRERLHPQVIFDRAMYFANIQKKDILFILNYPVITDNELVQFLGEFNKSIVPDEIYFLYRVLSKPNHEN